MDIRDNIWVNSDEVIGNGIDDDGNGYIDDRNGWNFFAGTNSILDDNGHGSHVAGIIGAVGNNGIGVVGTNWNVSVMPLKFLDSYGEGYLYDTLQAVTYAVENGAKVLSNSWGCSCQSEAIDDAFIFAHSNNVVSIVAAGNDSADALDYSPASVNEVITVGASASDDTVANFSNMGEKLDVVAPGVDILSLKSMINMICVPENNNIVGTDYCRLSGTSMATPFVSGLAALMLSKDSTLTPEEIRQIVRREAWDGGSAGKDRRFGYGRIDAGKTIANLSEHPLTPAITNFQRNQIVSGHSVQIMGSIEGPNFQSYSLEVGLGREPATWTTFAQNTIQVRNGVLGVFDSTTVPNGLIIIRIKATSSTGKNYYFQVHDVRVNNMLYLKNGFPVLTYNTSGHFVAGPSIHTLVANIDLDPQKEIVVTALASGPIHAWNHDGSPVTGWPPESDYFGVGYPVAGEFSKETTDSNLEIGIGYLENKISLYDGDGTKLSGWPKSSSNYIGSAPASADIDADGIDELITEEEDWYLHCYKSNGTVCPGWPVRASGGQEMHTPAIADIDKDGKLEIVSVSGSITSGVLVYAINHDGTVLPGFPINATDGQYGFPHTYPVIGDVDADGTLEIIVLGKTLQSGSISIKAITSAGAIKANTIFPAQIYYGTAPALADLNSDGKVDVIVQEETGLHAFTFNNGVFQELPGWPVSFGSNYWAGDSSPVVGDISGDGVVDILVTLQRAGSGTDGEVRAYSAQGNLLPQFPIFLPLGSGAVPAISDIDNDGKNDIVITSDYWSGQNEYREKVWAFDVNQSNQSGGIEWGQFGKDEKHTGFYNNSLSPLCGPAGDIDCNKSVNLVDLSMLLSKFGQSGTIPEDIDKNGVVNLIDLSILLSNFGKSL
jgi:hypothetical protein